MPRLTIGLPVRNGERYLASTLTSLLAQTWEDYVVLVGDNQSTDRTAEIVQDFAARDARIRYVRHETNLGVGGNFSRLVHLAETELFRWQASDDLVHPEYTARCIAALDPDPLVVLAYCRTMFIDAQGAELGPYEDRLHAVDDSPRNRFHQVYQNLVKVNALYGVMRRATLLRTQLIPSYERGDMAFLYELALYGKFVEISDRLFLRRMHPQNMGSLSAPELRMVWSPERWWRPSFATWHLLATLERAILRGPLTVRERALLQVDLAQEAASRGFRRRLAREAVEGISYAVSRALTPLRRAPASGVS